MVVAFLEAWAVIFCILLVFGALTWVWMEIVDLCVANSFKQPSRPPLPVRPPPIEPETLEMLLRLGPPLPPRPGSIEETMDRLLGR